jgi:hypothetical protein
VMTTVSRWTPPTPGKPRMALGLTCLTIAAATILASCGVGTGGTGSFGSAPVSGFGSIFVGGIEFDDSKAVVLDDDGVPLPSDSVPVRLGTNADVVAGAVSAGSAGPTAAASTVRIARLVVGPLASSDVAGRTLTVLGQTLHVNGSTVFDSTLHGGLAGVHAGDIVSVHALADAGGRPVATRVEPAAAGDAWRLRGFVSGLDPSAKRFAIGTATLGYGSAINAPANLANQQFVHVRLTGVDSSGVLQVGSFGTVSAAPADAAKVVTEGLVASVTPGVAMRIGAYDIDLRSATVSPAPASLVAGAQAQVEGSLQGASLVADTVTVLTPQAADRRSYRPVGTVSGLSASSKTFVVRGVGVDYSAARFVNGTAALLATPGVTVHVQGALSADGTGVQAEVVSFP